MSVVASSVVTLLKVFALVFAHCFASLARRDVNGGISAVDFAAVAAAGGTGMRMWLACLISVHCAQLAAAVRGLVGVL